MAAYRSPEETGERRRTARCTLFAETEAESKGQAGAEVPVLRFVRPDLSAGCAGGSMGAGASQQGRARGGWRDDPTDRKVGSRRGRVSEGDSGIAALENLCAEGGTARLHTKGEWEVAAARNTDGARPSRPDGGVVDPGTDL